jgi:acyl-CoA synthetase (NDP forming)
MTRRTRGLDPLFAPRTIAVIGASDDPNRIGGRPIAYMKRAGFGGAILPVNPKRATVQGLPAFASIADVGQAVDLAIVAVPGEAVIDAARACAACGTRSLAIFSAGFAETGDAGSARQAALARIGRDAGMRILGPNTLGLFNANRRAFPTFSVTVEQYMPKGGRIGIASQSGGYGGYVLMLAGERGLDIGMLITTGNECDVDLGDAIHWLAEDPDTDVILAYMEGCRSGASLRAGLEAARLAGKPVVAVKVGSTEIGAAAAASHTAALVGSDAVFDLVFADHGAYRARHTEEMLDIAVALRNGRRPRNGTLGLVTVSGGIGVHMSDLAAEAGLALPPLPPSAQDNIRAVVPFAGARNPLDVTGQVANDPAVLQRSLEIMIGEGDYGSVLVFLGHAGAVPSLEGPLSDSIKRVADAFQDRLILCCTTSSNMPFAGSSVLTFPDPPRAIAALKATQFFADRDRGPRSALAPPAMPSLDPARRYNEVDAKQVLAAVGVASPIERFARDPAAAGEAAAAIGGRVALKIVSASLAHKSDVGGVVLDLATPEAVTTAATRMRDLVAPRAEVEGFLVSEMVSGVECIVGVHIDPVFGPVVMAGLGGVAVELLQDVSRRLAPIDHDEALAMLHELRGFPLLDGYRGRARCDVPALADAIVRIAQLGAANAAFLESLEVNPLVVRARGGGVVALDCVLVTVDRR